MRSDGAFVRVGDEAFLLGGYGKTPIQRFDPEKRKWKNTKSSLNNIHHFQARSYRGKIYIVGALSGHHPAEFAYKHVLVYDPEKDALTTLGEMPTGRQRGSCGVAVYNDQLYVIGGNQNGHGGGAVAWMDRFNPKTGKWTELPDAPRSRDHFTAEVIGDRLYLAGGGRSSLTATSGLFGDLESAVDVFDFEKGEWLTAPELPAPLPAPGSGTVTAVIDGKLMVMGGMTGDHKRARTSAFLLNPTSGKWEALREMIMGRHATQAVVFEDRVYVAAGSPGGQNERIAPELPFVEFFSLSEQALHRYEDWTVLGSADHRRAEGQMITYRGEFYHFNGFDNGLRAQAHNEKYNPVTNRWTPLAPLPVAAEDVVTHTAIALVEDVVWLAGGRIGSHPGRVTDEVWLYNITNDRWSEGPRMPVRIGAGGLAHIGNKLHYVGGFDENGGCDVDDHWVYDLDRPDLGWQDYSTTSPMPMARNHFGTVVYGGKLYTVGGQHDHDACNKGKNLKLVHVYDPLTDSWERLADLPEVQSHTEPSTFSYNKKLYSLGGQGEESQEVWEYDPDKDKWKELKDLKLPLRLIAPGARIHGEILFVMVGGEVAVNVPRTEVRATYFGPNVTRELGFYPAEWQSGAEEAAETRVLLINYSAEEEVNYTIDAATVPPWLRVDGLQGTARESFTEIALSVDAKELPNGKYHHTLTATAPGYEPAELRIEFTVEGQEEVKPTEEEEEEEEEEATPPNIPALEAYWMEAECATLGDKWLRKPADLASNGAFVTPVAGLASKKTPPTNQAGSTIIFTQELTSPGEFHLYGRVRATSPDGDSFWLRINGGKWIKWDRQLITDGKFDWRKVPGGPHKLPAGEVSIELAYREAGIHLDKIYLTNGDEQPTGLGGEGIACSPPIETAPCADADCPTEYWAEAECHNSEISWQIAQAPTAANGRYIYATGVSDFTGTELENTAHQLQFRTGDLAGGTYYLFLRLNAADNSSNSFWIRVDDGDWVKFWKETSGLNMLTTGFEWRRVNDDTRPISFSLSPGSHLITVAKREIKTQFDKLVLRQNPEWPVGPGPVVEDCSGSVGSLAPGQAWGTQSVGSEPLATMLEVFPNPAGQEVNFSLLTQITGPVTVIVRDQNGRRVSVNTYLSQFGELRGSINVNDLPPGMYSLHTMVASESHSKPFIKN